MMFKQGFSLVGALRTRLLEKTFMNVRNFSIAMVALLSAQAGFAQAAAPDAQPGDEKINTVIVYGEDACQPSTDDTINVCARMPESDRYRIPKTLRDDINNPRREAWSKRVMAYEYVAASGAMSCSASGSGGFTGCGLKEIDAAYDEKKSDPGLAFGRMIAAERNKRLALIDAEAEEVEKRALQFEKERAEREARQAEAEEKAVDAEAGALPEPK
jgi:uncharacterized membrane protein